MLSPHCPFHIFPFHSTVPTANAFSLHNNHEVHQEAGRHVYQYPREWTHVNLPLAACLTSLVAPCRHGSVELCLLPHMPLLHSHLQHPRLRRDAPARCRGRIS